MLRFHLPTKERPPTLPTVLSLSVSGDRKQIREQLIDTFRKESPGQGRGNLCSKYQYDVETLADGKIVYLQRPAMLNKGFDFEVHVGDMTFYSTKGRRYTRPSHKNIIDDLNIKLSESHSEMVKTFDIIDRIYKCDQISDAEYRALTFKQGYPIEAILKSINWLFIEQDLTYWNFSGRHMFYQAIQAQVV